MPQTREVVKVIRLLSRTACDELVASAQSISNWSASPVYEQSSAGIRFDRSYRISSSLMEETSEQVFTDVRGVIVAQLARFVGPTAEPRFALSRFELIRYGPGGRFLPHRDVEADEPWKRYSLVLYVNDGFTGGQTFFPELQLELRPPPGCAILFPSFCLHAGQPVVDGTKYIMTMYLGDPRGL